MNIPDELNKLRIKPAIISPEDWEKYYQNIYDVMAMEGQIPRRHWANLRFVAEACINMFHLLEAGYKE